MRKGIRFAGAAIGKKRGGRAEGAAKAEAKQDRMADNTLSRKQKILARYPNMTGNEIMKTALLYALVLAAVMWLCFRNFLFCMAGVLFVPVLLRRKDREEERKKQMRMQLQFRKTMEMMYSSAAAGASGGASAGAVGGLLVIFLIYPVVIAVRIRNEEQVLREGLPGYADYQKRVKYRLVPFIW